MLLKKIVKTFIPVNRNVYDKNEERLFDELLKLAQRLDNIEKQMNLLNEYYERLDVKMTDVLQTYTENNVVNKKSAKRKI